MRLDEAEPRLRKELVHRFGQELLCTPFEALLVMTTFYRDERVDESAIDADGDMLLFQWGTYDWGRGATFEVDFTRQFVTTDEERPLWQLSLTFRFVPDDEATRCGEGNRWCHEPADLDSFEEFISGSPAMRGFGNRRGVRPEIVFEAV